MFEHPIYETIDYNYYNYSFEHLYEIEFLKYIVCVINQV